MPYKISKLAKDNKANFVVRMSNVFVKVSSDSNALCGVYIGLLQTSVSGTIKCSAMLPAFRYMILQVYFSNICYKVLDIIYK